MQKKIMVEILFFFKIDTIDDHSMPPLLLMVATTINTMSMTNSLTMILT